jgi:hypothetical protein
MSYACAGTPGVRGLRYDAERRNEEMSLKS